MKRRSYKFYIRRIHRYLGVFIGIQFMLWTLGGLYFSWTNIEEIRGDHLRKQKSDIRFRDDLVSPGAVFERIQSGQNALSVKNMRVIDISGWPFYEFEVEDENKSNKLIVADASTGDLRPPVSEVEAKKLATESLAKPMPVIETMYLTRDNVGLHHEYREKRLPAWAVTFENDLTVYLSADSGQIESFRTNRWRIFDFLWMLHTMDFEARDDFNNYLLRAFSILGLTTVLSGFLLFIVSSKFLRRRFYRNR